MRSIEEVEGLHKALEAGFKERFKRDLPPEIVVDQIDELLGRLMISEVKGRITDLPVDDLLCLRDLVDKGVNNGPRRDSKGAGKASPGKRQRGKDRKKVGG